MLHALEDKRQQSNGAIITDERRSISSSKQMRMIESKEVHVWGELGGGKGRGR